MTTPSESLNDPAGSGARLQRRDRTRLNDEAILDAAVRRIAEVGVDALSMREVASAAGLTSGAMYARYENAAELAVAVWEHRAAGQLLELLTDTLRILERDEPALVASVVERLAAPSAELRAAIEILVVSRRIDELAEVAEVAVPTAIRGFGDQGLGRRDESGKVIRIGLCGTVLGGLLYSIVPGMRPARWDLILPWHGTAGLSLHPSAPPAGSAPIVVTPGELHAETGDPLRDRIIEAVGAVVARSGFERATISRVARRAGCGIAAIYDRYPNRSSLVADAAEVLLTALDRTSVMRYPELAMGAHEAAAAVLSANVSPANATRRRLRLEVHVAAAHDPQIARALVALEETAADEAVTRFAARGVQGPEAEIRAWVEAARIGSRGMALVAELLPEVAELDFRLMTGPVVDRAFRSIRGG